MAQTPIQRQLAAGARAAKRGNHARARELLESVLRVERDNEQAWIWMAAIVDTDRERRICLERVLKANPDNQVARKALNSMVGVIAGNAPKFDYDAMSRAAENPLPELSAAAGSRAPGGQRNLMPILIGVAVVLGVLFALTLIIPAVFPEPEPTPTPTLPFPTATDILETATPTRFMTATTVPSPTFSGTAATREVNLPATFTPTVTETPTNTPPPTATLPPVAAYEMLFLGQQGSAAPSLYRVGGSDNMPAPIISNLSEIEYNSRADVLVYSRDVPIEGQGTVTRLFYTSLADPTRAIEITDETIPSAFAPAISPDGAQIAFTGTVNGNDDIFIYTIASGSNRQITTNPASEIDPTWSPDGRRIVFASDRDTPGRYELFLLDLNSSAPDAEAERITDSRGNHLHPAWSPQGDEVAFLNINGDEQELRVLNIETQAVRRLTFQPNNRYSAPDWTDDGLYVVYTADDNGSLRQIYFVLSDDTNRRSLFPVSPLDAIQVVLR